MMNLDRGSCFGHVTRLNGISNYHISDNWLFNSVYTADTVEYIYMCVNLAVEKHLI